MLWIISPHLGDDWRSVQKYFVSKYTSQKYKLIQFPVPNGVKHIKALNKCMKVLKKFVKPDDLCVVFDSDAWPVNKNWIKICSAYLKEKKYCAVQRTEADDGRHIAHPCFVCWPASRNLEWATHGPAKNPHVKGSENQNIWKGFKRTNAHELHPRLYSIYGNIVYHHGAGSRDVSGEHKFVNGLQYQTDFWANPGKFIRRLRDE